MIDDWMLKQSPVGEDLKELDNICKVLNQESTKDAEKRYREIVKMILVLLVLRTERLLLYTCALFAFAMTILFKLNIG